MKTAHADRSQHLLTSLLAELEAASGLLEQLAALSALKRAIAEATDVAVVAARVQRHSWPAIAKALGSTKQTVFRKYKPLLPDAQQQVGTAGAGGPVDLDASKSGTSLTSKGSKGRARTHSTPRKEQIEPPLQDDPAWVVSTPGGRTILRVSRQR